MKDSTRIDWHRRVDQVIISLLQNLDCSVSYKLVAEEAAASPDHFHRQFKKLTGETFKACTERLKLEKAMVLLRESQNSVTEIAFECGYTTVEMLCKAVKKQWGMTPVNLRKKKTWHPVIPSLAGIHYREGQNKKNWYYVTGGEDMETKIVHFEEKEFYGYEIQGDYWQLPELWDRLMKTLGEKGLHSPDFEYLSLFRDSDPGIPMKEKRAMAGFVCREKLSETLDFKECVIPEGLYAVTVHFGSSENIGPVWDKWMKEWLPQSGWEPDFSRPNYEWYQNRMENPELLLTFLVTAVKRVEE